MTSIVRWKVSGAFRNSKRIQKNLYCPWCDVKTVSSRPFSSNSTSQYPLFASNIENTVALPKESIHSSVQSMRYKSRSVMALSLLKPAQNCSVPSFLSAKTMSAALSVYAGSMAFFRAIYLFQLFQTLSSSGLRDTAPRGRVEHCRWLWYGVFRR